MFDEPLQFVLERLFDLLKHEATILSVDEKKEIESLQRELQLIESYLRDMDEIQRQATLSHVLKTKLQHLMQVLPEIEGVLDNWIYQKVQQAHRSPLKNVKAFFKLNSNSLIRKHKLVKRVAEIREGLDNTLQKPEKYQLPSNYPQVAYTRRRPRTNPFLMKDEIIVGIEEDVETLVAKFLGKDGERGANTTIVGMGGSGKTTLAKMFYNHEEIKEAFPNRRAWVCVSQEWDAHDLLLQICEMLNLELSENQKKNPHVKLQEFLEKGACLFVLDDVWDKKTLEELLPMLLVENGRVLITTRKEKVVKFPRIGAFYLHRARRLTPQQSWELFSRIVGNCCEGSISFEEDGEYVKLGEEMLEKCDGLPLAIVTLAGLLGTKDTIQQWESIKERVISIIMGDESEAVEKVLELSYSDLPYALKPCFLYLGTFKEDEEIQVDRLINLWICEGFVKADPRDYQSQRLEERGKDILEELVQRCMIQATERDYEGDLIEVRIHDLIRDLCINKAIEHGLFQVLSSSTTTTDIKPSSCRAIIYDRKSFTLQNPRLRTLISKTGAAPISKELFPFEKLKQLRVLCLQGVELGDSAEHIGNMVLLRCLRLERCYYQIDNLYFIKKLRNLEILIIKQRFRDSSVIPKLADNMRHCMEQLRVICLVAENGFAKDPSPAISGLTNLKNLETLALGPVCPGLVNELQSSRNHNLRELRLFKISSQPHLDDICVCVSNNLPRLETLCLDLDDLESGVGFDLQKMKWGSCQLLKEIKLIGKIIMKHHESWLCPPKLLFLLLYKAKIEEEEDMDKFILGLDHLRELQLQPSSYMGDKLTLVGLHQLRSLTLNRLSNLKECKITQGSLPKLQQLDISSCNGLERIPDGISDIHTLQHLRVVMPERFCKRLGKRKDDGASEGGEDFHLVQHTPTITFSNQYTWYI